MKTPATIILLREMNTYLQLWLATHPYEENIDLLEDKLVMSQMCLSVSREWPKYELQRCFAELIVAFENRLTDVSKVKEVSSDESFSR